MDNDKKIEILLKEYDTLRAEIIARATGGYAFWGFAAAAVAWAFSKEAPTGWKIVVSCVGLILAFAVMTAVNWSNIARAATRVGEIERRVNELADEELLQWEHRWGCVKWWRQRFKPGPSAFRKQP